MELLITMKPVRVSGELLSSGEMFRVAEDGQAIIDKGYARRLTTEENNALLDSYVAYAEEVFGKPTTPSTEAECTISGTISPIGENCKILPERQLRPLASLPPDQQREAYQKAKDSHYIQGRLANMDPELKAAAKARVCAYANTRR